MKRATASVLGLFAVLVALALPTPGAAQPICPPGYVWRGGACRPFVPPPPRYVPPPVPVPPPGPAYDPTLKQVARKYVTLRSCPGDGCPPVGTLSYGTPVRVIGREGPFVRVHVPGSRLQGWVRRRHLMP